MPNLCLTFASLCKAFEGLILSHQKFQPPWNFFHKFLQYIEVEAIATVDGTDEAFL